MRAAGRPAALLGALAALVGACGGGEEEAFRPIAPADPGPVHVHALGVDPADGALLVATHTGLYRLGAGEAEARRVAGRYQDTMGFTVVGPGHYLGSGHPDLEEAREQGLPPLLGLVESRDGGESWNPISLLGEADFHVIRVAGERVYAYDSAAARLMVSDDRGRTWRERPVPAELVDLAVSPADPSRLVASTAGGLFTSGDGGERWRPLFDGAGLLAWPAPDRLYLAVPGGLLFASADAGESFEQAGSLPGEPAALLAPSPGELYAALHDGTIVHSRDGGASFSVRFRPEPVELTATPSR